MILITAAFLTGVVSFALGTTSGAVVVISHGAIGIALPGLVPWKSVIVRRGLRRRGGASWPSVVLMILVGVSIVTGLVHSTAGSRGLGPFQMMQDGRVDFEALQSRLVGNGARVDFIPFDILEIDGQDLRDRPFTERRKFLESIGIEPVPQTDDMVAARAWFEELDRGTEGVVAKKKGQPYLSGERARVKVKAYRTIDLVVGGLTPAFGLLLGAFGEDGRFHHVGTTSPLKRQLREEISPRLDGLLAKTSFDGNRPE